MDNSYSDVPHGVWELPLQVEGVFTGARSRHYRTAFTMRSRLMSEIAEHHTIIIYVQPNTLGCQGGGGLHRTANKVSNAGVNM